MASMMKIAALLLLGMVLVASAAEVAQEQALPSVNNEQVIPGRYKMDAAAMMMHQRRLQTLGFLFGRGYGYPYGGYYGGYPGNFGGSASAAATAASTPYGSSASAAASAGGFNGYNGGFPFGGGFGFNGYNGFFG